MTFRHYDSLRTFRTAARTGNFTAAADELNITKGAVSHQIRTLEDALGFRVFDRLPRGVSLTLKGRELHETVNVVFSQLDRTISELRSEEARILTIGVSTYFASRWLSPRLMDFMQMHPGIRLRIQPMIDFRSFTDEGVDVAIRWGTGGWPGSNSAELFRCPAFPTGNRSDAEVVRTEGAATAFSKLTLFSDHEESTAWADWFDAAGLMQIPQKESLIIPDPNVRVQAVIDGQGVALNDHLILPEIRDGKVFRLSDVELEQYGYHIVIPDYRSPDSAIAAFSEWIRGTAADQ